MKKTEEWKIPGCQKIGDTYYLTYTRYNNVDGATADRRFIFAWRRPRI